MLKQPLGGDRPAGVPAGQEVGLKTLELLLLLLG